MRHRTLHHRWVFLQVPSPTTIPIPCPSLPPGPPAASLIYWFSAARRAINHGNGSRRWLGCGVQRDRQKRKERTDGLEEEVEEEGWRWAQQPLRAADRLLMVFVCPGPVPVQGADSPGCYIKELWVFRGLTWARGHINWAEITCGAEIYMGTAALLILSQPIISALLLRRRGGGGERSRVGARWAHGNSKCRCCIFYHN